MNPQPDRWAALVTGANSGIGEATARALHARGHYVICAGRRLDRLQRVVDDLGDGAAAVELDLNDAASIESLPGRLNTLGYTVDILVNNAGHDRGGRQRFHDLNVDDLCEVIQTNVLGTIRVTHALIRPMVARNRGHIITIGSVQGLYAYPRASVYTATKFALHGFSECLRLDYVDTDLRITEIQPGLVRTEFAHNRWDDADRVDAFYARFNAWLTPSDVAAAVIFALEQPPHVDVAQVVVQPSGRTQKSS
ncbi:MAG: SDR family oxidoreductase [Pseudomonadota bacterium]